MAEVIHKVNITAEARFDCAECLGWNGFDLRGAFKREVEEYITYRATANRIPWWGYFRCDYEDEDTPRRLKLFFYKGERMGLMQFWDLAGVCFAEDWTEEAEDDGQIRAWLKTKIKDIEDDGDNWVVRARVHEILQHTEKTLFINVLKEVQNAFKCERDKETATRVAFLQSVYFEFRGRRHIGKKDMRG